MAQSQLIAACDRFNDYPQNMPRGRDSRYALSELFEQLESNEKDLFDPDSGCGWDFLETYGNDDYEDTVCKDRQELEKHLSKRGTDPRCRLVFIQSEHSAAALDGSKDMMKFLLSFHQVMPSFLRLLANWGILPVDPSDPHCYHKAAFHHENVLNRDAAKAYRVVVGRSGLQIRHCYSVWGVEKDDGEWRIRQTTLYHSLDVVTGKAVWINIKANEIMKDRMSHVAKMEPSPEANSPAREKSIGALTNSLEMHALAAEWCSQDWGGCIQSVEQELRAILDKLKNLPVAAVERSLEVDAGALMQEFEAPRRLTRQASSFYRTHPRGHRPLAADGRNLTGVSLSTLGPRGQPTTTQATAPTASAPDPFRVIREFNFKGLQRLDCLATKLQQFSHTMQLNCRILSELDAYYTSLRTDRGFPAPIKRACGHHLDEFRQRLQACIRAMELERERAANLLVAAEDGKRLYDVVMQLRYMETSKLFAVAAHQMTREMQAMAEKTKRETTSMHIITAVTLFFLPGTFVATFLGSGMFQWDQDDKDMPFPNWRPEYFKLFVYISAPMMVSVLAVWLLLYLRSRGTRILGLGGPNDKADIVRRLSSWA